MLIYKKVNIEKLYNGFYEFYINGKFYKADSLKYAKLVITKMLKEGN